MKDRFNSIIDLYGGSQYQTRSLVPERRTFLSHTELDQVTPQLRHEGTLPLLVSLPNNEVNLLPFIKASLVKIDSTLIRFFYREIRKSSLPLALTTGTDRNRFSYIDFAGGENGERLAMIENGLDPKTDCNLVTYAYDSALTRKVGPLFADHCLLIYPPQTLKFISSRRSVSGDYCNGFAMFVDPRIINRSLRAVFLPSESVK
jgi:hypothetical protein